MGGRKAAANPAIQFVSDFDYVTVASTVAYRAGHVVKAPSDELLAAAGDRAVPYVEPPADPPPPSDGE